MSSNWLMNQLTDKLLCELKIEKESVIIYLFKIYKFKIYKFLHNYLKKLI